MVGANLLGLVLAVVHVLLLVSVVMVRAVGVPLLVLVRSMDSQGRCNPDLGLARRLTWVLQRYRCSVELALVVPTAFLETLAVFRR